MVAEKGKSGIFRSLVQHGRTYLKLLFDPQTPWHVKALMLAAAAYVISPVDLIPDWILGFGILDDLTVGTLLAGIALRLLDRDLKRKSDKTRL